MQIDFKQIGTDALGQLDSLVQAWLPGGTFSGDEYKALNPTRQDGELGSFSINTQTGLWSDFASGDSGCDAIDLYAYINQIKMIDAAKAVAGMIGQTLPEQATRKPRKKNVAWSQIAPIPAEAVSAPDFFPKKINDKWIQHKFLFRWEYCDRLGNIIGYIGRCEIDGKKEIIPLTYRKSELGECKWKYKQFDEPRPLMGLNALAHSPGAVVIIVEGEKCVEMLQEFIGKNAAVMTWSGGCKAVEKADWSALNGRKVILWPDADAPGIKAMNKIAEIISGKVEALKILKIPSNMEKGWDCADAIESGWDMKSVHAFIKQKTIELDAQPVLDELPASDEQPPFPENENYDYPESGELNEFQYLGYSHGNYYYLPAGSHQVLILGLKQHNQSHLLGLAPLQYWERNYFGKNGPNWTMAANALIRKSEKKGVYNPKLLRGSGAWYDNGRVVLHLGDHLVVDGSRKNIDKIESRYIYEAGSPAEYIESPPINKISAHKFQEICSMLNWEKKIYGKLLAGWCVIAPICGALDWRPHIWITGGSGTGKTYTMKNIVNPCIGPAAMYVQSATTEAGIRQGMGNDAWPIIFDEIEAETQTGQNRVQIILELMRQASSDTGASILKGSASGSAVSFKIRSSFCLSSIGVNATQVADVSRISTISLKQNNSSNREEAFVKLNRAITETLTDEYCAGLRARSISLIPIIRKNAIVFGRAIAQFLGNQRVGDQIGALLAGAFALTSDSVIDFDQAMAWIEKQAWEEHTQSDVDSDESACMAYIMEQTIKVPTNRGTREMCIGEMLQELEKNSAQKDLDGFGADDEVDSRLALARYGVKLDNDFMIIISDSHSALKRLMIGTAWPKNWGRILRRLKDADIVNSTRFHGIITRATKIPYGTIFNSIE